MQVTEPRPLRILDFDIENRPLSYWQPDRPTAEITAIAWCWVEKNRAGNRTFRSMQVRTLPSPHMLADFVAAYNEADMVTGHYIRRHDLPIINGALYEEGLPLLSPKLTCDTKLDMFTKADIPATQEFLLETLGIPTHKYHMSQTMWREANRLTTEGRRLTEKRVTSDVKGHILMRDEMLRRGMLRPPKMWDPGGGTADVVEGRYVG